MTLYKHTQISYLVLAILLVVVIFFVWAQITTRAEAPSVDSGANFFITATMTLIVLILVSFVTLTVSIDENYLRIKFGYGIFRKKFLLNEIMSARSVKNHWYYGWGVRVWFWLYIWIYNISGFGAVEVILKNGRIYRVGTDEPKKLEEAISRSIKL